MKIRSKLFVLLVSLTLTSLLGASFVSINILSAATIREIRTHLEDDSANLMNRISMNTSDRISDITFLGHFINVFLNQSGTELGKKLELMGTHKDYSSILMVKMCHTNPFSKKRFKEIFIESCQSYSRNL
jgi:hypothetical protein